MRISYVINGLNGGGAALPLPRILETLRAYGHEVSVIALSRQDGLSEAPLRATGVSVEVLCVDRINLWTLVRLIQRLRMQKPDLIWTSLARATIFGQIAGALLGIPVVSWLHNVWLKRPYRIALKYLRERSILYVADSRAVKNFALSTLRIPAERIVVWPLLAADAQAPVAEPWRGRSNFRIGSLGRLHYKKGYDRLIRGVKAFEESYSELAARTEFLVAGVGDEHDRLEAMIKQLDVKSIRLVGYIDAPQHFLAALHAYVQPSRGEGLCIAAHEAMVASLPVVATPVGELAFSITNGVTGLQVDADDEERFAATIASLVEDPVLASRMGWRAREYALRLYASERFAERGLCVLRKLCTDADSDIGCRT